jgi:hypothetical protein
VTIVLIGSSSAAGKNLDIPAYGGRAVADSALDPTYQDTVAALGAAQVSEKTIGHPDSYSARYATYLRQQRPGSKLLDLARSGASVCHFLPDNAAASADPAVLTDCDSLNLASTSVGPYPYLMHNITEALALGADAIILGHPSSKELGALLDPNGDGNTSDAGTGTIADVDEIVDMLEDAIAPAEAAGIPVWIASPNPTISGSTPESVAAALALKAAEEAAFGAYVLDFWTPRYDPVTGAASRASTLTDGAPNPALGGESGTHPSAEGDRLLFEVLVQADLLSELP